MEENEIIKKRTPENRAHTDTGGVERSTENKFRSTVVSATDIRHRGFVGFKHL